MTSPPVGLRVRWLVRRVGRRGVPVVRWVVRSLIRSRIRSRVRRPAAARWRRGPAADASRVEP